MVEEIELNDDFKRTLDIMKNSNESLLITGRAGTGKSPIWSNDIKVDYRVTEFLKSVGEKDG